MKGKILLNFEMNHPYQKIGTGSHQWKEENLADRRFHSSGDTGVNMKENVKTDKYVDFNKELGKL